MGNVIMTLEKLSVGYRLVGEPVGLIKDIGLDIRMGEVVCLLGQNGVGKSTLLRTLAGLQPPLEGNVSLHGKSLSEMESAEVATAISVVLTEKVTAGNLSVEELVALGRHPYTNWLGLLSAEDRSKTEDAISLTKINYIRHKKLGELSDGQYQKAMIGRAVAQDGQVMLLDEPTAFLDLNNSVEIFMLLRQLAYEKQKAVVVSTHDFHLAMQFADRLWLTNFNSPLCEGLPEDLALDGRLEESMYHEGFGLDMLSGRIKLPANNRRAITVCGSSPAKEWTERALERKGFLLLPDSAEKIVIEKNAAGIEWNYKEKLFTNIRELIDFVGETLP